MANIEKVAQAVRDAAERETNGNLHAFAIKVGVPYDALYALAIGRRRRSVDVDTLVKLSARIPEVRGLFAPHDSQVSNGQFAK